MPRPTLLSLALAIALLVNVVRPSVTADQAQPSAPTASNVTSAEPWDTTLPRGKTRDIDFTTTEGTWMSVDLSPDGQWIVFDLLGHIYRVRRPAARHSASRKRAASRSTCIRAGRPMAVRSRSSPTAAARRISG